MQAPPMLSFDEARAGATFDALIWALAEPGSLRNLPEAGHLAVAHALIDRECSFHASADLAPQIAALGGQPVTLESADFVFADATDDLPARLFPGNALYPDAGATLIAPARLGLEVGEADTDTLRLTGPGIKHARTIAVGGISPDFWAARARALRYPLGFDIFLLDGARVIGLPRTTLIEVL